MARSTDLNNGLSMHIERVGTFCANIVCLLKGKHNLLKLVYCAKQGFSKYIHLGVFSCDFHIASPRSPFQ
jgi:hypothetical protein